MRVLTACIACTACDKLNFDLPKDPNNEFTISDPLNTQIKGFSMNQQYLAQLFEIRLTLTQNKK